MQATVNELIRAGYETDGTHEDKITVWRNYDPNSYRLKPNVNVQITIEHDHKSDINKVTHVTAFIGPATIILPNPEFISVREMEDKLKESLLHLNVSNK